MPTAAKLVGAISLAFVSIVMVYVLIGYYPEERWDRDEAELVRIFGAVGLLVGWFSLGKRVETEEGSGIYLGLRAGMTVGAYLLFLLAAIYVGGEILDDKLRGARPMQAVLNMFEKVGEYFFFLMDWRVLAWGAAMFVTVGVLVKNTHKRWK